MKRDTTNPLSKEQAVLECLANDLRGEKAHAFGSAGHLIDALDDAFRNGTVEDVRDFLVKRLSEARDHERYGGSLSWKIDNAKTVDVLCVILATFIENLKAERIIENLKAERKPND
jgi:hypothetical protein